MSETVVRVSAASFRTLGTASLVVNSFWNLRVSTGPYSNNGTRLEDLKHLVEVQPPGGDRLLVALGMETPRDDIPSTPLD